MLGGRSFTHERSADVASEFVLPAPLSRVVRPVRLLVCVLCVVVAWVVCLSIYLCEALDGIVAYTRPGQDTPDEFVRIDIRGKAFVYVSVGRGGGGGAK